MFKVQHPCGNTDQCTHCVLCGQILNSDDWPYHDITWWWLWLSGWRATAQEFGANLILGSPASRLLVASMARCPPTLLSSTSLGDHFCDLCHHHGEGNLKLFLCLFHIWLIWENKTKVICANSKFELRKVHPWKIFTPEKYSPVKIFTHEKYSPLRYIHIWKIFTPEKYSPLRNVHPWKIFTHEKYSPLRYIHLWEIFPPWEIFTPEKYSPLRNVRPWKIFTPEKFSPLKIFTPEKYSHLKNIYPWKIFTPEKYSTLMKHKIGVLSLSLK